MISPLYCVHAEHLHEYMVCIVVESDTDGYAGMYAMDIEWSPVRVVRVERETQSRTIFRTLSGLTPLFKPLSAR